MSVLIQYLTVFGMAMLPVLELRGAMLYGVNVLELELPAVFLVSVAGNMLPIPFIILFLRRILSWMKTKSAFLHGIAQKLERKAEKKIDLIHRYELLGLVILVGIPLPGTGAWTGAMVAALFDLRVRSAVPAILVGVVIAGAIMSVLTYGVDMLV